LMFVAAFLCRRELELAYFIVGQVSSSLLNKFLKDIFRHPRPDRNKDAICLNTLLIANRLFRVSSWRAWNAFRSCTVHVLLYSVCHASISTQVTHKGVCFWGS
jgi:hypothetical protein